MIQCSNGPYSRKCRVSVPRKTLTEETLRHYLGERSRNFSDLSCGCSHHRLAEHECSLEARPQKTASGNWPSSQRDEPLLPSCGSKSVFNRRVSLWQFYLAELRCDFAEFDPFVTHTYRVEDRALRIHHFPIGLSLAYKEFQQGTSTIAGDHSLIMANHSNFYGMTGPAGLGQVGIGTVGISLMVNATIPFILASQDDGNSLPDMPQAYGFNMLLLSSTSAAFLDAPMPAYVEIIQRTLATEESLNLTANVHATISTYNSSIEEGRNEASFWEYYQSISNVSSLSDKLATQNMYQGLTLGFIDNDLGSLDSSFCFLGFVKSSDPSFKNFQQNATLFDTRRGACTGT